MDEIRLNNKVDIETQKGAALKGSVTLVEYDRVAVNIDDEYLDEAKKIKELDELKIAAKTHFGIKTMISAVISTLDKYDNIVVENNPSLSVEQKREHVRVMCNFNILVNKNDILTNAAAKNISAGGIAISLEEKLNLGDEIEITFPKEIFEQDFKCSAKIIKINDDNYIAQFDNISETNESKITKYVFKNVSKSSMGF